MPESTDYDIQDTFDKVVSSKKRENTDSLYKTKKIKRKRVHKKDEENFVPYASADKHTEDGLAINSFERQAQKAEFSVNDRVEEVAFKPGMKKWCRLKKKMVPVQDPRAGKIRTESGIWIPKTYKTGRYDEWKEKNKIEDQVKREVGEEYSGKCGANGYPSLAIFNFLSFYCCFCYQDQAMNIQPRALPATPSISKRSRACWPHQPAPKSSDQSKSFVSVCDWSTSKTRRRQIAFAKIRIARDTIRNRSRRGNK